jgi:hypothetical protein
MTISIPSTRALLLTAILILAAGLVVWVAVAENVTQGRAFPPPAPDNSSAADWLGAVGTVVGAFLTGGALLVAALSYRKQVADRHQELVDQHRAQAIAVTVGYEKHPDFNNKFIYFVHNGSNAGIYNVRLFAVNDKEEPSNAADVVPPGKRLDFDMPYLRYTAAAEFEDSAGVSWLRDSRGLLEEQATGP